MKKGIGFFLGAASVVLALIAVILYQSVQYHMLFTTALLVAAIVAGVVEINASMKDIPLLCRWLPIVRSVLLAGAFVSSFTSQINQIGYVIAALDPFEVLNKFVVAASLMGAAMLVSIAAGFFKN